MLVSRMTLQLSGQQKYLTDMQAPAFARARDQIQPLFERLLDAAGLSGYLCLPPPQPATRNLNTAPFIPHAAWMHAAHRW